MKELITELVSGANSLFYTVGGTVALAGLLIVFYWLHVMFDDKQTYDGGFLGFIKLLFDSFKDSSPSKTEPEEKKETPDELPEEKKD